jgi:primosomal protein N' (replication factor Y)
MKTRFVDVALGIPSKTSFQYAVAESLSDRVAVGKRVYVGLNARRMVGYIVGLSDTAIVEKPKEIQSVIDEMPVIDLPLLELTRWIADYYACGWGQAIEAAMPAPFKRGRFFMKSRPVKNERVRDIVNPLDLMLTKMQQKAYQDILAQCHAGKFGTALLYGITGSGKTEVYMHIIRELILKGRSSIVLVPEISLTPQTVDRFISRFGECVAVIHSRLNQSRRVEEWHRIKSGAAKVVVGARSAIFSPVQNLSLIVIDEEHETSYKQTEAPRYHARETAAKRAEIERAVLVLGSATPSLETYQAAKKGESLLATLSERIENRPLPVVEIVDMRRQRESKSEKIFSVALENAIQDALSKKEQVMLLLNRRGFSTYLHCSSCGYVMNCPNCRISLAYHFDATALICHVCHYRTAPLRLCPGCSKNYLHYFGTGTQKVEQESRRLFPDARVGRMDTDSTSRKDAHETILRAFKKKELDILIGTQMIAKGHDFPNVSLIGVVSADTALYVPDFRAGERTFDLLTQVAGRAGRGDIPGKVLIQTFAPFHYAIQSAKDHDFLEFYEKEIAIRSELQMPPFLRLIQVIAKGKIEKEVVRQILHLSREIQGLLDGSAIKILGPAPCATSKQHGFYLWNFYMKGPEIWPIRRILDESLVKFKKAGVSWTLDVDPQ